MNLNKDKWYVHWYFWSLGICEQFSDNFRLIDRAEIRGTNLCAFMRVIIIYAPLILLLHAIVYAAALATVTVWPIYLFGLKWYGIGVGALVALVLTIIVVVKLVIWLLRKREEKIEAQEQLAKPTNDNPTGPSFLRIVGQWVMAKKRKICPLITFAENNKEVRR